MTKLPADEHDRIRRDIAADALIGTSPQDRPIAIILAGQPGAGKGALAKAGRNELEERGGAVLVDTDALRAYHTNYDDLMLANDRMAAKLVQEDAGRWADELAIDTIDARRNLIVDGTLKTPENAEALCRQLKAQGYEVEVRAVAASREDSVLGIYKRYERQKAELGAGRWVPEKVHNDAYKGMPCSLDLLEREGLADCVRIYRRDIHRPEKATCIYERTADSGSPPGAARAVGKERERTRTPEELAKRERDWATVVRQIEERDTKLEAPENRRAIQLAAEARDKAPSAWQQRQAELDSRKLTKTRSRTPVKE